MDNLNMAVIMKTELPLSLLGSGKVRDIYELPDSSDLLFVTTDRVSCFDVILKSGIPSKGAILTALSTFWCNYLLTQIPNLRTHIPLHLPPSLRHVTSSSQMKKLADCSVVVRRLRMLPIESIVRGYLSGSAWASYQKDGTVCGIKLRDGLQESQKLDHPIWTPSTKAPAGEHDINIGPEQAAEILGEEIAAQVEQLSLQIYQVASDYARSKGIIIADTKLEFGLQESTVVLADEVLTPDSSRFWSLDKYEVGKPQQSIDKQVVRDWLLEHDLQGKEGVELPDDIVAMTRLRYKEAFRLLTEREWED